MLNKTSVTNPSRHSNLHSTVDQDDEFTARVAHSEEEICQLIEAGFEYICNSNGEKFFRKRK